MDAADRCWLLAKVATSNRERNGHRAACERHAFFLEDCGTNIHSQVQLYEPEHRLGWTGTAMVTKAAHIWELKGESPDRTLVTMKESMDGPWMAKIYPSAKLTEAGRSWLVALKQAVEADKDSN